MTDETAKPHKSRPHAKAIGEDVVWSNVDTEQGDDITLEPIDPATDAARRLMRESEQPKLVPEVIEEPAPFQFTIKHMLIANTALAVTFALMQLVAPSAMAGFLGVTAFFAAIFVAVYRPEDRSVQIAWWCLLALYVVVCMFALVGALRGP